MNYLSLKDLSEITGVKVDLKKRDEILSYVEALSKTNIILISNRSYLIE